MLFLLFYVGRERYVCDSQYIVEVVPNVKLKELPHTPPYVAGLLNSGGSPIPIIDFCQLIENRPSQACMHTRIIVLSDQVEGKQHSMGIIAEKVTETIDRELSDFVDPGVLIEELPFLGKVLNDYGGMIRMVQVPKLFESMESVLF
ncbi:chemotaxis signal transduction protein CheW [Parachlamydia acanthamoebae UV-7]|jgi:chemotaxis-related protein WspB|uniref:Chemotaxis signal transduction protein CheW n=2 Tax=Parachlamydia acanthamoebae TaxID=83552 RepID=F8KZ40_PARAV|nr:chemotaxis protein CheW [Parachlamydia acanthamoebae]EFB41960.1 hypothetical protein pah_c022o297 [Parachlamydia acanthamoebae str. Hall's coccus]CCB86163.1 chemotaxis signal transduction protein CheW [Parachlamydia acanthamoebae UV-7]